MKRCALVVLLVVLLAAAASAQTSVGVILGEPTGLSGKQWTGERASLDVAVAWSFVPVGAFYVHADYQQHFDELGVDVGRLLLFAGLGGRIYMGPEVVLGARIPLGIVYEFEDVPLEVFLELAPGLNLVLETIPSFGGGVGVRYRL